MKIEEENKKFVTNAIISILMLLNPYRIYIFIIEIIHSIALAFRLFFDALVIYIKSLPFILIPLFLLVDYQLYEPAVNYWVSTFIANRMIANLIMNFTYYVILWPFLVSAMYLSFYQVKMRTWPKWHDLVKSTRQNYFKILQLRLLVLLVTAIVLGIIFGLYIYWMPGNETKISYKLDPTDGQHHWVSNYLAGNILFFIAIFIVAYILMRLILAESLIVLKGYKPLQAIDACWEPMSGRIMLVFFSLILMWIASMLVPYLLHLMLPAYSEMLSFFVLKLFGAYYFSVVVALYFYTKPAIEPIQT